jgi:predicted ATPase
LELGPITILVGENNAGKSSLLRAIHMVQASARTEADDIRIGAEQASVVLEVTEPLPDAVSTVLRREGLGLTGRLFVSAVRDHETGHVSLGWPTDSQRAERAVTIPSQRPHHLMVPFFSRRKSAQYESTARRDLAREVDTTDRNLTSRIAELSTGAYPAAVRYRELVDQVLGLQITTFLTDDGQVPGQPVAPGEGIALTRMGEGVSSAVAILTELAVPGRRMFLIEEPETDLHPKALGSLLDVFVQAADQGHQFLITTHSDVVLRHLGARSGTRIYGVDRGTDAEDLSLSSYRPLDGALDREQALLDLGYEQTAPYGWLLLEEASGETFIRDVIIPLFVPRLGVLRTVSSNGAGNLAKRLDGLNSMLLFAHLSSDTHRAWVIADGDDAGRVAANQLVQRYSAWPQDRFRTHSRANIEAFYPPRFAERIVALGREGDGRRRSALKGELVQELRAWAISSPEAEGELAESASDLIELLRSIERSVSGA